MTISKRHHYIPKFYLKGFTNNDGEFAIFDKERNVLKNGMYSPKSHFFEKHRNTFTINGQKTDFLEKLYSRYDDQMATLFQVFQQKNNENDIITPTNIQELKLFIAMLFWRIPDSDNFVDNFFDSISFDDLIGIKLTDKDGNEAPDEIKTEMFNDPHFRQSCRYIILPINTFKAKINESDLTNWRYHYSEDESPHFCSDQPIIFKNMQGFLTFDDTVIIPLTKNKTLVFTKKMKPKKLPPKVGMLRDTIIFGQAKKFVCSSNKEYLGTIAEIYFSNIQKGFNLEYMKQKLMQYYE